MNLGNSNPLVCLFSDSQWDHVISSSLVMMHTMMSRKFHQLQSKELKKLLDQFTKDRFSLSCRVHQVFYIFIFNNNILRLLICHTFLAWWKLLTQVGNLWPIFYLLIYGILSILQRTWKVYRANSSYCLFFDIEQTLNAIQVILTEMHELGWSCDQPQAELISDITRDDPILYLVSNVILETLGVQAAQVSPDFLIKLTFTVHCSSRSFDSFEGWTSMAMLLLDLDQCHPRK